MNLNKFFKKTNLSLTIIIVIGILIVLNFFSYNIFYRFDLTQNKDYSLSKASKQAAAGLKDIVSIKVYFSADLPSRFLNLRQEVSDILDEYANYSGGKIKVEFIDPKDDQAVKQELYLAGIPELQFNALEKDKYQVINGYLGMLIKYGEKFQTIPVIQDTKDLEYQITSTIKKLTSDKIANIGFWQGNGVADTEQEVSAAYKKLGEIYNVSSVNYSRDKKITDGLDILIIIGPKEKFNDNELKAIDAFLMSGGSLVILADGVKVEQGLSANKNDIGLNKILQSYGVKLNENLAIDVNNGIASFSQGFVTFSTNYPYWPKVIKPGFDQNNPAVSRLESLVLPWASTIDIIPGKTKDATVSYLALTSDRAMTVVDNFKLDPQAEISRGTIGKFNLAVSLTDKFVSPFNNASSKAGHLILAGDSDFIKDNFLQNYPDNLVFFQNIIDGLSLGNDLISIRSKGVTERPLKEISESGKAIIRYANIFSLTIIVMFFGVVRYFLRRRTKFEDQI
ncbi:GldG family protein [Patescibacteria group bacterium]|nr:GldG family protein [Patescibacteria group bacterium]MBU1663097.1 GldG family protein [Patescibacteria group bacterium]MBU1934050.1 GldG family protein [Patescibacteria group bacterium]MBU2008032.1 GldG family protein [Patescibacteria group bacterium]MBU2233668.1 GldG family protein [Patescibacteria group bacterium]